MLLSSPLKTLIVAAFLGTGLTGAAFAQDQIFTAKLAAPATHAHIVADNTVWTCQGDTCRAIVHHSSTVYGCRQLERVAGPLTAYGPDNATAMNDSDLAQCNGAPQTQTAQTQQPATH